MDEAGAAFRQARAGRGTTLDRLITLLRFPTVSADPRCSADMWACARWLAGLLCHIGLTGVRVWPGRRAPVVTAAWRGRPGRPTVLVYGHYDVQPVAPRAAWATSPFQPVQAGPHLYARGVSDDKGQLMAHLAAIESYLAGTPGGLPVNLTLILDGEEEIGSPTLVAAVARRWPPLAADVAVVSDTWMLAPDHPVLITGLRGTVGARLEVTGPARDLHAGSFGGALANPAEALAALVASLHDKAGRVAIAGFYDQVRPMTEAERCHLARAGPTDASLLAPAAVPGHGEPGFSAFERVTRRPSVVATNLRTSGAGRTVVPAWAAADLNVRLVASQRPGTVAGGLRRHLRARAPAGARARLLVQGRCPPYNLSERTPLARAARAACRSVFGREPALLPSGGSIPFVSTFAAAYGCDVALLGFGLPDDATHAPNERFYLPNLFRGTDACIELYRRLGAG